MATSATGRQPSHLLYVTDRTSKLRLLIDTGAEISLVPPTHRKQNGFSLQAANGTQIVVYGRRSLTLNLGLQRTFQWIFVIVDVKQPIIRADFLYHFNLLVDLKHKRLIAGYNYTATLP